MTALVSLVLTFVMPPSSILRHLAEVRAEHNLVALRVDGTATFTGGGAEELAAALGTPAKPQLEAQASVVLKLPGRCRFELGTAEGQRLAVVNAFGKARAEVADVRTLGIALQHLCPLLASRGSSAFETRAAIDRHLKSVGVETSRSWLARFGGNVAYVIGEKGEGRPQAWIYKDDFLPARLRYVEESTGAEWDIRFLDYTSPATGEWFPRIIEVWKAGQPLLKFTAHRADSRPKVNDRMF